jgi:hypothetical protein
MAARGCTGPDPKMEVVYATRSAMPSSVARHTVKRTWACAQDDLGWTRAQRRTGDRVTLRLGPLVARLDATAPQLFGHFFPIKN